MSRFPMIMRDYAKKALNLAIEEFNEEQGKYVYDDYDSDDSDDSNDADYSGYLEDRDGVIFDSSVYYYQCYDPECNCDMDHVLDCVQYLKIWRIICEINRNTNAIDFLMQYPEFLIYEELAYNSRAGLLWYSRDLPPRAWANPSLIEFIEQAIAEGVEPVWPQLSKNKAACHILEKNLDKVDWDLMSMNRGAAYILENHTDKINWKFASINEGLIKILEQNLDKVHWPGLTINKNAGHILAKNLDKIDWTRVRCNDNIIRLIEANIDKMGEFYWVQHICAMPLITPDTMKDEPEEFKGRLSCNRSAADLHYEPHDVNFDNEMIFTYDYNDIKKTMEPLTSMITGYFYRPDAVARWIENNDIETIGSEEYLISATKF